MPNEHPPRPKSDSALTLLQAAREARERAALTLAQSKQGRGMALSKADQAALQRPAASLKESVVVDDGEEPQQARVIYKGTPEAVANYVDTGVYNAADLHAAATDAERVVYTKSGAAIAGDVPRRIPATTAGIIETRWATEPLAAASVNDTDRPRRVELPVAPQDSGSKDVPRRAPARPRFSETAAPGPRTLQTYDDWLKELRGIVRDDSELSRAAEEYRKKKRIDDEPTERIVIEEGPTQVSKGADSDDRTMSVTERSERFRAARDEFARAVGARSSETTPGSSRSEITGNEVLDRVLRERAVSTLVPEVTNPTLNPLDDTTAPTEKSSATRPTLPKQPEKPRGVRGWLRRVGYALGFLSTVGAGVGMYETMKGNAPSGVDTGDNPNQIALIEQGDTADSADSADSGDTADSAVDSSDSTDTGMSNSKDSGDSALDSADSADSGDSGRGNDSGDSKSSTDSFDSGETASDSFNRGGTGEYPQDTADSGDSADSSDSRDSSGDTGLESGSETGDSSDSTDSTDSFRDTRGGTGMDSADTALDSADSGVDSTDSTDTGSFDSTDSGNSRDSFGGTGFDNDSADSADTMFYGGTGFTGTDSGDSQGMDSSDSFDDTGADSRADSGDSSISSETAHSGDSGDTADTGDTGKQNETAANGMVQPEVPPAPTSGIAPASTETRAALIAAAAAQDARDHRTLSEYDKMSLAEKAAYDDARAGRQTEEQENIVRTRIENGEGISQAMLRLGVPIENITQALDDVEVVVGDQINTLRNLLIDASEAKGNQLGMNILQNPDGTIRGVEFYSVANPEHILTGSEMAELAHFDALSVTHADRQIHTLERQLDDLTPGTELYYSPLVIRLAEDGGAVQVRHITDGEHYYELTPEFLSVLGVDFTKYDKSKKEFLHEAPEAPLTRRLFRELAAKEGLSPINR